MFQAATITEITGLTLAGATDETGTWNTNVDLSSFVTVPTGATGVHIRAVNTGTTQNHAGIRMPGATQGNIYNFISMNAFDLASEISGNLVDLYVENSDIKFYIIGFYDSEVTWFDQDASPPTLDGAGGTMSTKSLPAGLSSGISAFISFTGADFGSAETLVDLPDNPYVGAAVIPCSSDQVRYRAFSASRILAEVAAGGFDGSGFVQQLTLTIDNTWRTANVSNNTKSAACCYYKADDSAHGWAVRQKGQTPPAAFQANNSRSDSLSLMVTGLDVNGEFEYVVENQVATASVAVMGFMAPFVAGGPALTIDQANLTPGGTISGSYTGYAGVPTSPLTLTDEDANSITVAVTVTDNGDGTGTFTGTMPALPTSGSTLGIRFGDVTVELT